MASRSLKMLIKQKQMAAVKYQRPFYFWKIFTEKAQMWSTSEKFQTAMSLIIDNVFDLIFTLCQSYSHCRSLIVPANFNKIVEDAENIQ